MRKVVCDSCGISQGTRLPHQFLIGFPAFLWLRLRLGVVLCRAKGEFHMVETSFVPAANGQPWICNCRQGAIRYASALQHLVPWDCGSLKSP